MKTKHFGSAFLLVLFILQGDKSEAAVKRCYQCRSRGPLGDCKDPFSPDKSPDGSTQTIPCASGWCAKIIEGQNFKSDDYGTAVERICLVSAPSDHQERCTEAIRKDKKLTLCSCTGDLCNTSTRLNFNVFILSFLIISGMVVY
ncbi:UPAR/Ly6 domain-containing protein rtv-like [Artemia franciscana]|uniref:UPAR/Ly6 domain-containing protein rtv-like n=1 Tax=Artemia franciscana TaxID=6661 RepID=UPI0032D9BDC8